MESMNRERKIHGLILQVNNITFNYFGWKQGREKQRWRGQELHAWYNERKTRKTPKSDAMVSQLSKTTWIEDETSSPQERVHVGRSLSNRGFVSE